MYRGGFLGKRFKKTVDFRIIFTLCAGAVAHTSSLCGIRRKLEVCATNYVQTIIGFTIKHIWNFRQSQIRR